jgi:hypothetical protein
MSVSAMFASAVLMPLFVAMPVTMACFVDDDRPVVALYDDGRRCVALDHHRGRSDKDRRWRRVDRKATSADEAAYDAPDKTAEGRIAGVGAVSDGVQRERGQGRAGTQSNNPLFHLVTSRVCGYHDLDA